MAMMIVITMMLSDERFFLVSGRLQMLFTVVQVEAEVIEVIVTLSGLGHDGRVINVVASRTASKAGEELVQWIEAVHPQRQEIPVSQTFRQPVRSG